MTFKHLKFSSSVRSILKLKWIGKKINIMMILIVNMVKWQAIYKVTLNLYRPHVTWMMHINTYVYKFPCWYKKMSDIRIEICGTCIHGPVNSFLSNINRVLQVKSGYDYLYLQCCYLISRVDFQKGLKIHKGYVFIS